MGEELQWQQTDTTGDNLDCAQITSDERLRQEQADEGGVPATKMAQVSRLIDPSTAGEEPYA